MQDIILSQGIERYNYRDKIIISPNFNYLIHMGIHMQIF